MTESEYAKTKANSKKSHTWGEYTVLVFHSPARTYSARAYRLGGGEIRQAYRHERDTLHRSEKAALTALRTRMRKVFADMPGRIEYLEAEHARLRAAIL